MHGSNKSLKKRIGSKANINGFNIIANIRSSY